MRQGRLRRTRNLFGKGGGGGGHRNVKDSILGQIKHQGSNVTLQHVL